MKKTTKNIIIALAVLLVLGIAAAVLLTLPEPEPAEESSTSSAVEENTLIIDHSSAEVEQITIENNIVDETWEIVPYTAEEETEESGAFTFKGWENANVLTTDVSTVARSFYMLYEMKEIGDVQDLSEYGLDGSGEVKAVVDYKDGTKETVIVGVPAGETSGRYVLYNDVVYIASFSSMLEQNQTDFVATTVLTIVTENKVDESGLEMEMNAEAQRMHFSGKNYPKEILLEALDHRVYTHVMSEPIFAGASTTQINAIIEQLTSITASGVAAVNATEEDMAEWGLDEPSAVLDFEINSEEHEVRLGNLKDGEYSLMIDDDRTIYLIPKDRVDTWASRSVYDLRETYVYLVNIKEIEKLTVEDPNGTNVYNITRILNEEKTTEASPFYDITIKKDGKNVDYETAYQPFYVSILSVCVMNEEFAEPKGDAVLTITYKYFEGGDEETLEFYAHPDNDRRYVVLLNGQNVGVVRSSDVEDLIEKNEIVGNYGALEEAE